MRLADGILCSTEYLARRYRTFNPTHLGVSQRVDLDRYDYERAPARDGVTIGWAGGIGHRGALGPGCPGWRR